MRFRQRFDMRYELPAPAPALAERVIRAVVHVLEDRKPRIGRAGMGGWPGP